MPTLVHFRAFVFCILHLVPSLSLPVTTPMHPRACVSQMAAAATAAAPATDAKAPASAVVKKGLFIVIEGLDRSGKTTQCELLRKRVSQETKASVAGMKFPQRGNKSGKLIDAHLKDKTADMNDRALHLQFSSNRWESVDTLRMILESDTHLICDRYTASGTAYSVAKGLPLGWCLGPDQGLPVPDLTVFIKVDPANAKARDGFGDERFETVEFQAKVAKGFDVHPEKNTWTVVDGNKSVDEVHAQIWAAVAPLLKAHA